MPLETTAWTPEDGLKTAEARAAYIEAALEDGNRAVILAAIGDVAKVVGMAEVAREAGLGRESLYKALSANGNPRIETLLKVFRALNVTIRVTPSANDDHAPSAPWQATGAAKP